MALIRLVAAGRPGPVLARDGNGPGQRNGIISYPFASPGTAKPILSQLTFPTTFHPSAGTALSPLPTGHGAEGRHGN